MKTAVLYHNDADGFGAAYAFWTDFGERAVYIPVQYGQPVPELPKTIRSLFIVDFSYDRATCEALAEKYKLRILDHHKTAEAELAGLPYATFNMNKSGAVLAWENRYPNQEVPDILLYVQDRDLWRFKLSFSEERNLYIATLPGTFEAWGSFDMGDALAGGRAIKAFRDAQMERAVRNVRFEHIAGHDVPLVNLSDNISEAGNLLCQRYPEREFSASYCDRKDGRRSYSLRSIGEFDVSAIAKQFGGGGHRNAAGFTIAIPVADKPVWINASTVPGSDRVVLTFEPGVTPWVGPGYNDDPVWRDVTGMVLNVSHWMELPGPPEGGEY